MENPTTLNPKPETWEVIYRILSGVYADIISFWSRAQGVERLIQG